MVVSCCLSGGPVADLIKAATNAGSGMPWSNCSAVSRPVHRRQVSPRPMWMALSHAQEWRRIAAIVTLTLTKEGCVMLDAVMHVDV